MEIEKDHEELAMAAEAVLAPVTTKRKDCSDLEIMPLRPDMARAFAAVDTEHPDRILGYENRGMSVLQQHVSFFDQDKNGVIYPWETFAGLQAIGISTFFSIVIALVLNAVFSFPTSTGWIPSPFLPVYIHNIHKGKYGSDTGTYDTEGRQLPVNLENIFSKYARTVQDKLTLTELWNMTEGNRVSYDFFGWTINKLEWGLVYAVAKDESGFLSKEAVRGVFDGSLFESLARKQMETTPKMS